MTEDGLPTLELGVISWPGRRPPGWRPFASDPRFRARWWDQRLVWPSNGIWVSGTIDGVEHVRVELDESVYLDSYPTPRRLPGPLLEIEFIEVARDSRGRGLGTSMVAALTERYPGHVLVAFSEGADSFWESLHWTKFEHPEGWPHYRPVFLQPR